jgi:Mg-chelatase subunit ChlD
VLGMKQKATGKLTTQIILILDRSGSMQATASDTRGSVNKFIKDQAKVKGLCKLSIVQFNTHIENTCTEADIADAPKLDDRNYSPSGNTGLLDAIGLTVTDWKAKSKLPKTKEAGDETKFIVVIMTDGLENASTRYSNSQIKELIQKREKKGWEFLFLGANQDAFDTAKAFGIRATSVSNYAASPVGTAAAYGTVSGSLINYREKISRAHAGGQSVNSCSNAYSITDQERAEIEKHVKAKK